jgi:hypothetical protein
MTTLNDLIRQSQAISNRFISGDIPIYVNGTSINIKLEEKQDCEGKFWVDMTFNKDV